MKAPKKAATFTAQFGGFELRDNRVYQGASWSDITGASAQPWYEQSNKGPDVGRAIGGLIGGAVLGALFGFLIIGGVIALFAFAIVIGLVAGLKTVEHAKAHVTVTYPDGRVSDIPGPVTEWTGAQYMAAQLSAAGAHCASVQQ